ncbi:hypothetical protein CPLU01_14656 [Colletotrichum plurivorum]|uniref:Uncharacterized protein n=1 Tax=Colletotrichum plurivorum TaxID=2175906 RepID=A0A8H6MYX7_9PEZI|nr:hypothetical protein CPLU01_14656 [Colletotrichum plurivorum]
MTWASQTYGLRRRLPTGTLNVWSQLFRALLRPYLVDRGRIRCNVLLPRTIATTPGTLKTGWATEEVPPQMRRFEWGGTCSDARPRLGRTLQAAQAVQEGDHRIPGSAGSSQDASRAYCRVGSAPFPWNPCPLGFLSRAPDLPRPSPRPPKKRPIPACEARWQGARCATALGLGAVLGPGEWEFLGVLVLLVHQHERFGLLDYIKSRRQLVHWAGWPRPTSTSQFHPPFGANAMDDSIARARTCCRGRGAGEERRRSGCGTETVVVVLRYPGPGLPAGHEEMNVKQWAVLSTGDYPCFRTASRLVFAWHLSTDGRSLNTSISGCLSPGSPSAQHCSSERTIGPFCGAVRRHSSSPVRDQPALRQYVATSVPRRPQSPAVVVAFFVCT